MTVRTGTNHSATLRVRVATRAKNLRMGRLHRSPPATRDPITWSRQPRSILIRHDTSRRTSYVESHVTCIKHAPVRCRQVIASGAPQRGGENSQKQDLQQNSFFGRCRSLRFSKKGNAAARQRIPRRPGHTARPVPVADFPSPRGSAPRCPRAAFRAHQGASRPPRDSWIGFSKGRFHPR